MAKDETKPTQEAGQLDQDQLAQAKAQEAEQQQLEQLAQAKAQEAEQAAAEQAAGFPKVFKNGVTLTIHPSCVQAHVDAGWVLVVE